MRAASAAPQPSPGRRCATAHRSEGNPQEGSRCGRCRDATPPCHRGEPRQRLTSRSGSALEHDDIRDHAGDESPGLAAAAPKRSAGAVVSEARMRAYEQAGGLHEDVLVRGIGVGHVAVGAEQHLTAELGEGADAGPGRCRVPWRRPPPGGRPSSARLREGRICGPLHAALAHHAGQGPVPGAAVELGREREREDVDAALDGCPRRPRLWNGWRMANGGLRGDASVRRPHDSRHHDDDVREAHDPVKSFTPSAPRDATASTSRLQRTGSRARAGEPAGHRG